MKRVNYQIYHPGGNSRSRCHIYIAQKEIRKGHPRDYAEIAADGTLHAATEYNSISFYVDGDTLSGFHYELIEAFARDHGLQVAITPE